MPLLTAQHIQCLRWQNALLLYRLILKLMTILICLLICLCDPCANVIINNVWINLFISNLINDTLWIWAFYKLLLQTTHLLNRLCSWWSIKGQQIFSRHFGSGWVLSWIWLLSEDVVSDSVARVFYAVDC